MNALSAQIKKINTKDKFLLFIVSFFPVTFILGNLFINTFIIILSLGFFINLDENKKFFFIKEIKPLYLLFFSLLINLIFSINILNSLPRITKIIFVIIFVMEIIRLLRKHEEFFTKYVLKFWSLLVLIITFDCYFEYFSGQNLIGNTSAMQGRLSSFFGDELVAGAFIYGFALYFLSYLILSKRDKKMIIFFIISIIICSFLIGERSNFIKLFISLAIFIFFNKELLKVKRILIYITSLIGIIFIILMSNGTNYKNRYYDQIFKLESNNKLKYLIYNSQYGAHYSTALSIFKNYPFFGVGVKNFRIESRKELYNNEELSFNSVKHSTHPHQLHFEILAENGFFGYFIFIIFIIWSLKLSINNYLKRKNLIQLASMIYLITSLLPLLPSGSFLSTFNSGIFWINYALMLGVNNNSKIYKI